MCGKRKQSKIQYTHQYVWTKAALSKRVSPMGSPISCDGSESPWTNTHTVPSLSVHSQLPELQYHLKEGAGWVMQFPGRIKLREENLICLITAFSRKEAKGELICSAFCTLALHLIPYHLKPFLFSIYWVKLIRWYLCMRKSHKITSNHTESIDYVKLLRANSCWAEDAKQVHSCWLCCPCESKNQKTKSAASSCLATWTKPGTSPWIRKETYNTKLTGFPN